MIIFYKKKGLSNHNNINSKNNNHNKKNNNNNNNTNTKNIKSNSTPSSPNSYSTQQQQQQQQQLLNKSKSLNNHNYNNRNNSNSNNNTTTINIYKENDFIKSPAPKHVVDFLKYAKDTLLPYQVKKRTVSFLEDNGDLMHQFLSIHEDYKNEYVPLMDVYKEIVELFKDYPELIAAYINTLPKEIQCEIRYSENYNQSCVNNFINAAKVYSSSRRQYNFINNPQ